ncbi:O-antigen polymerase [Pseudoalteromonas sp. SA25]|uniref:O-antigen polymerase n=1 Tax=Pseudoalteromonas sp. SA25 TaxID=2686347 RepID=UPI0013FD88E2|nr:O-antigen polymerase [Pseudoalteromonas sp. SA25]
MRKKTGTFSLAIPIWVMVLWLFKGGIDFSIASISGGDLRYENELFPVNVDIDYLLSYLIYFLYFTAYCLICFIYSLTSTKVTYTNITERTGIIESRCFILFTLMMVCIYIYYGYQMYQQALGSGLSVYHYSRFNGGTTKSLMTLTSWIALTSCIIGIVITTKKSKFIFSSLLVFIFVNSMILGNRHILLSGLLFYFVLILDSQDFDYKKLVKFLLVFIVLLSSVMSIYVVREAQEGSFSDIDGSKVTQGVLDSLSSSEFIYSHMSMYGVIANDVDVKPGQSLLFLVSATLPRVLSNSREDDIYTYYIENVSPNPFKGFTIANPTGWYLNFGLIGVFLGGIALSCTCCLLHYSCYHYKGGKSLFFLLLFSLFLSDSIGFMRSGGPEPFRAVFLIKSFIPALCISFILRMRINRSKEITKLCSK